MSTMIAVALTDTKSQRQLSPTCRTLGALLSTAVANRCLESIRLTPLSFTASVEEVEARSLLASLESGARFVSSCVAAHGSAVAVVR